MITIQKINEIGPTLSCRGCSGESQHHDKECREWFNAMYGHKEPEIAPSPEPAPTLELATHGCQPEQSSSSSSSSSRSAPPVSDPPQEGQQEVQVVFDLIGLMAFCSLHHRAKKTLCPF